MDPTTVIGVCCVLCCVHVLSPLPSQAEGREDVGMGGEGPASPTEALVAELWKEVLGLVRGPTCGLTHHRPAESCRNLWSRWPTDRPPTCENNHLGLSPMMVGEVGFPRGAVPLLTNPGVPKRPRAVEMSMTGKGFAAPAAPLPMTNSGGRGCKRGGAVLFPPSGLHFPGPRPVRQPGWLFKEVLVFALLHKLQDGWADWGGGCLYCGRRPAGGGPPGVATYFFELGGHSIHIAKLRMLLQERLGVCHPPG